MGVSTPSNPSVGIAGEVPSTDRGGNDASGAAVGSVGVATIPGPVYVEQTTTAVPAVAEAQTPAPVTPVAEAPATTTLGAAPEAPMEAKPEVAPAKGPQGQARPQLMHA